MTEGGGGFRDIPGVDLTHLPTPKLSQTTDPELLLPIFIETTLPARLNFLASCQGFMVYLNVRLALACFVIVPAIVIASDIFAKYMRVLSKASQDALAKANAHAEEVVSSISTVRAFAAEKDEARRYEAGMSEYLSTIYRQAKVYYFYSSITFTFLPYLTYCIILFFAAQLIHTPEGCVPPGSHGPRAGCPYMPPPPPLQPGMHHPPPCSISGGKRRGSSVSTPSLHPVLLRSLFHFAIEAAHRF